MKIILFILLIFPSLSYAEKKLIGKGLLEYSIFKIDVYEISHYRGSNGLEELVLDYKTDVKKEYSIEGWDVGLKPILKKAPSLRGSALWLKNNVVDLKKGDVFTLRRQKDMVSLIKNDKILASIKDKGVAKIVFEPWLGAKPVSEELKRKLLKNI